MEDHILHNVRRREQGKSVSDDEVNDYICKMSEDREWFTQLELELAADALQRPVQIWTEAKDGSSGRHFRIHW